MCSQCPSPLESLCQVPDVIQLQFCRSHLLYMNCGPWHSVELTDAGDWAHEVQKYFFLYSFPGLALWTVWLWSFHHPGKSCYASSYQVLKWASVAHLQAHICCKWTLQALVPCCVAFALHCMKYSRGPQQGRPQWICQNGPLSKALVIIAFTSYGFQLWSYSVSMMAIP